MNKLMIIILGLAVVRTLTPLVNQENWTFFKVANAVTMCWAFYHLLFNCATVTFNI